MSLDQLYKIKYFRISFFLFFHENEVQGQAYKDCSPEVYLKLKLMTIYRLTNINATQLLR